MNAVLLIPSFQNFTRMTIYLDYNSTTPVDPHVLETMLPYFSTRFGNASSKTHSFGWVAEQAVTDARQQVAKLIGAEDSEIIFTSGATEAINLAMKGVFEAYSGKGKHIITSATEHKAVLDTCAHLEKSGARITILPVQPDGLIDPSELTSAITDQTILVSIMYANNETGVIQNIRELSAITHAKGSIFMSDSTQACGKIRVNTDEDGIDLLALSAHKIYGPKGCGALFVRRKNPRVKLIAQIDGGGHEKGLRSGTLNVPGIVGFGKACELAHERMWEDNIHISKLRSTLEQGLIDLGNISVNGNTRNRLPNTSNLAFTGIKASTLMKHLPDIAFASGSACTSALAEPSHVLRAMQISEDVAYSSVRFSIGRHNTTDEINICIEKIREFISKEI